jgi:hypothetical protein
MVCCSYLSLVLHVDSWSILAFHALVAVALCVLAKALFATYTSQRSSTGNVAAKKAQ